MAGNIRAVMQGGRVDRDEIVRCARAWIGTPYHHQASRLGIGADCLGLVRGVYRSVYGKDAEEPPPYTPDWGEAVGKETLLAAARRILCEGDLHDPRPGDVLVFRMFPDALAKHTGIMTTDTMMVHAAEGAGVLEVPLVRWWRRRLVGVFGFPGIEV